MDCVKELKLIISTVIDALDGRVFKYPQSNRLL